MFVLNNFGAEVHSFKLSKAQISNYTHKIITPTTPPPTLMNKQQVAEHIIEYLPS